MEFKDIKAGDVVEYADGRVCIVLHNDNYNNQLAAFHNEDCVTVMSRHSTDGVNRTIPRLNIVKVWSMSGPATIRFIKGNTHLNQPDWDCTARVKEMTVGEISRALGYDVKVVK